jgi:O-antigen/teichoic acid export membrane protein
VKLNGLDPVEQEESEMAVPRESFSSALTTLLAGNIFAQIIPIAATPALTRFYAPGDFGAYALFLAVAAIASTPATLRYSHAILLPKDDSDAIKLSLFCMGACCVFAFVTAVVFVPFSAAWAGLLSVATLIRWVWAIPLAVLFLGVQTTLYSLCNRFRFYKTMAASRLSTTVGVFLALLYALFRPADASALIWAYLLGQLSSVLVLAYPLGKDLSTGYRTIDLLHLRHLVNRYRNFAIFSLPADALNALSLQAPPVLIAHFFSNDLVGYFNMTMRVVVLPLNLFGMAILDVFKQKAAWEFSSTGSCREVFLKTFRLLAMVGVPLFVLTYPFLPKLFSFVLGATWRTSGEIAQTLAPLLCVRFIVSPLSYVVYIAEKQKLDLFWQFCLFIVIVTSFLLGGRFHDFALGLHLFSWTGAVMYILYFLMNFSFAKR